MEDQASSRRTEPERELVIVAKSESGLQATDEGLTALGGASVSRLANLLASEGATMVPLFGDAEDEASFGAGAEEPLATEGPSLSAFFGVTGVPDERLDTLAERLRELEVVDAAYVKPPTLPPVRLVGETTLSFDEPPSLTPSFRNRQGYLNSAPGGIDAVFAWSHSGGTGSGMNVIDIEGNWHFAHEDLRLREEHWIGGELVGGVDWRNHGTAVVGEINGEARNAFGIAGICADAAVRVVSHGGIGSSRAIRIAADSLGPGDIVLLEMHRPGPRFDFQLRDDQRGYIAVEWWPDDFLTISYARNRGVIVVEAAGNGGENLDHPLYDANPGSFPSWWRNPLRRPTSFDSGAIVVGAGAPPSGTWGPDRSRLDFSNWGALIDAQGWGLEVATTGYGDLQGGSNEGEWYTDQFGGTSGASPIVVGALGCIQGIRRAAGKRPLEPRRARGLLRTTGTAQQDASGRPKTQRIGNRPNLREVIDPTPPSIRNVRVESGADRGHVEWETDRLAFSRVEYGTTPQYGFDTGFGAEPSTHHDEVLTGLIPNKRYYYRVSSETPVGHLDTAEGSFYNPEWLP